MATKRDIEIASLLFRSGLVSQEDIQSALGHQGTLLTKGEVKSLVDILAERGLLPEDARGTFTEDPLEKLQPFPDYDLHEFIGDGASARVYKGIYKPRELDVAVKVLHPEQELLAKPRKRFLREAHLLCKMRHPNIIRGYELRKIAGFRFLSMEWFLGSTVLELIDKRGRLDDQSALHVTRQIASALAHLYEKGILHRDIKPGNVLADDVWNVKLIDLGLCLDLNSSQVEEMEGTTVGTVGYISPEQAKGVADLDIRSDIYSLGVSLYHMVVGEVPFTGDDDFEVMSKQIMQALKSDAIKKLNISPQVHYVIQKMMSKERTLRYQEPKEIVAELDAYLESVGFQPIPIARPSEEPDEKTSKKKRIDVTPSKRRSSIGTRRHSSRRRRRR